MPGVEDVEALLGAKLQHMHKQQQPRSARVNTLKMSVPQALAWLRSPPPAHRAFAAKVCAYRDSASASAKNECKSSGQHSRLAAWVFHLRRVQSRCLKWAVPKFH